jgi:Secretion system C-terminal sorting domain
VRIIDMSGKILKERDYDNVKKQTISLDVNDIPNGVYNIQVQTIGNYRNLRFVKAQ